MKKYNDNHEEYNEDDLREALTEFIESCHRTDHHDREDNIRYFLRENNHIKGLAYEDVEAIYDECER